MKEVASCYQVPITTLHNWRSNKEKIVASRKGQSKALPNRHSLCHWQELVQALYQKYKKRREEGKAVRRGWMHRKAPNSYKMCYPEREGTEFRFSDGWFNVFLSGHAITLRFTSNKSQKIPDNYLADILSWMRFNCRNSQLCPGSSDENNIVDYYLHDSISNLDETPLPFKFLDGLTYADKGSKSVQVKASYSGWGKRQAFLLLAVFGSGKSKIRPLIIFKRKEKYEGKRREFYNWKGEKEMARYDLRVEVCWNENAYTNSNLLVDWINQILVPVLPPGPRLQALDVAKFHSTDEVLFTLRSHDIVLSLIPPGCTGLVQSLEVSVNKPFKCWLGDILDELLDAFEAKNNLSFREIPRANSPAIAKPRILVTQVVGEAWEQFTR